MLPSFLRRERELNRKRVYHDPLLFLSPDAVSLTRPQCPPYQPHLEGCNPRVQTLEIDPEWPTFFSERAVVFVVIA